MLKIFKQLHIDFKVSKFKRRQNIITFHNNVIHCCLTICHKEVIVVWKLQKYSTISRTIDSFNADNLLKVKDFRSSLIVKKFLHAEIFSIARLMNRGLIPSSSMTCFQDLSSTGFNPKAISFAYRSGSYCFNRSGFPRNNLIVSANRSPEFGS